MSYMQMCLRFDGKEDLYLRVPTFWDDIEKQWIGFIKTPKTKNLIFGTGKDSFELQNSFNRAFSQAAHSSEEMGNEILSLFKPKEYWEKEDAGERN